MAKAKKENKAPQNEEAQEEVNQPETEEQVAPQNEEAVEQTSEEAQQEKSAPARRPQASKGNTAIVLRGVHEVRRYDLETHGKNFVELANEFAGQHDYTVRVVDVKKENVVCPKCGHSFHYEA